MQSIQCRHTRKRFYDCEQNKNYVTRSMCASNQQNNQFKCEFQLQVILRLTFTTKSRQMQSKEFMSWMNLDFFKGIDWLTWHFDSAVLTNILHLKLYYKLLNLSIYVDSCLHSTQSSQALFTQTKNVTLSKKKTFFSSILGCFRLRKMWIDYCIWIFAVLLRSDDIVEMRFSLAFYIQ